MRRSSATRETTHNDAADQGRGARADRLFPDVVPANTQQSGLWKRLKIETLSSGRIKRPPSAPRRSPRRSRRWARSRWRLAAPRRPSLAIRSARSPEAASSAHPQYSQVLGDLDRIANPMGPSSRGSQPRSRRRRDPRRGGGGVRRRGQVREERSGRQNDVLAAYYNLAMGLDELSRYDSSWRREVKQAYEQALEIDPNNVNTYNNLAWSYAKYPDATREEAQKAVDLARKALDVNPDFRESWNTLGGACYRAKQWKRAHEALDRSMALHVKGGDAYDSFLTAMTFRREKPTERNTSGIPRPVTSSDRGQDRRGGRSQAIVEGSR